jgi:C1A family cysteine protease
MSLEGDQGAVPARHQGSCFDCRVQRHLAATVCPHMETGHCFRCYDRALEVASEERFDWRTEGITSVHGP